MSTIEKSGKPKSILRNLAKLFGLIAAAVFLVAIATDSAGGMAEDFFALFVLVPIAVISGFLALVFFVAHKGSLKGIYSEDERRRVKIKLNTWLTLSAVLWASVIVHLFISSEIGMFFTYHSEIQWLQLPLSWGSFLLAPLAPFFAIYQVSRLARK